MVKCKIRTPHGRTLYYPTWGLCFLYILIAILLVDIVIKPDHSRVVGLELMNQHLSQSGYLIGPLMPLTW